MNARRGALALLCSLIAVTACGNDTDSSANRAAVLANLSTNVITPGYEQFDQSTAALATATAKLCEAPDKAALTAARSAWARAWTDWNRTRAFRFGPLDELDAVADIAFMVDTAKIDKLLADAKGKPGPAFTAAALGEKGADVRGLAAIEHLLFTRDPLDPNPCAYAAAAAKLVADAAHEVEVAWTEPGADNPAFRDQLAKPGDGRYLDEQAAVGDLVNGLSMALTESTRRLASAQAAPPGEREETGSHGGSRLRDELWSVRASYFGAPSGTEGEGVSDLVAAMSPTADERAGDLIERAESAAAALPPSLADASEAELANAYKLVRNAGTIVRAEVASELGVTLSLGDADGDS
jgi:predicted lipoprotein